MLDWHVGNLSDYCCIYQSKCSLCLKFSLVSMVTQHRESPANAQFPDTMCFTHAQKSRPSLPARYSYTTWTHPDLKLRGTVCESALYSFPTRNLCHIQSSQLIAVNFVAGVHLLTRFNVHQIRIGTLCPLCICSFMWL